MVMYLPTFIPASTNMMPVYKKLSAFAQDTAISKDNAVTHPANMPRWLVPLMFDIQLKKNLLTVDASPMQDKSIDPSILAIPLLTARDVAS